MNKSYISVWNDASGTWVAAPETAKTRGGAGASSSAAIVTSNIATSLPVNPFKLAFMPIAMAIGAAILPGTAAAQVVPGNGSLQLCSGGWVGVSYGPFGSGGLNCGGVESFGLTNSGDGNGAYGYSSETVTAGITGFTDGRLQIMGQGGITIFNTVSMTGNKITDLAAGTNDTDAVNVAQLNSRIRYFHVNSTAADSTATGNQAIGIGPLASASGDNSIALGNTAFAGVSNSVAIGNNASALASNSVALGANSVAARTNSVSVGAQGSERQIVNVAAGSTGTDAVNLNQLNAAIASVGSVDAVMYDTSSHNKVTFGGASAPAPVTLANVADGKASNDAVNVEQLKAMGASIDTSGHVSGAFVAYDSSSKSNVTLGGVGAASAVGLTNVAAGQVNTASKDAINGSQLYGTANSVAAALGGGTTVNTNGTISAPAYTLDGSTYSNVGAALAAVDANANMGSASSVKYDTSAHTKVTLGGTGSATPVTLANVADGKANNDAVNVEQLAAMGAKIDTSGHPSNAFVAYDDTSRNTITLQGASGSTKLTHLTAGAVNAASTDGINGSQLYGTSSSVANALGGGASVNGTGAVTNPTYNLSSGTFNDVGSALGSLDSSITTIGNSISNTSKYIKVVSASSGAIASGGESVAIGGGAYSGGQGSIAIGVGARSQYADSVALGSNSVTSAANTISVGSRGAERRIMNVANGVAATDVATFGQLTVLQTTVSQLSQQSSGVKSMLLGAAPTPSSYIAVSSNVTAGTSTSTDNTQDAMAVGPTATAYGAGSLAVGAGAGTNLAGSTAVGNHAAALGLDTTAIGASAGTGANAMGAVAIGYNANAQGANALSLGSGSLANEANSVAIGSNSFVNTGATNSMALGFNAMATGVNSVALGANSVADRANTISVGSSTAQRQVVNVAAGTSSTDAVNVSQLAGVTAALGGGAGVSGTDGSITKPSYTIGGKTYSDVGSAIAAATASGSANAVMYDSTVHSKVTLGGTGSSTPVLLSNVADGVANNDAVNVEQLKAMGASVDTSGHITNAFVSYDDSTKNTITLKGASGSTKITGLTAGTLSASSTDAVNGTQLYATNQNVANVAGNVTNVTNTINNITNGTAGIKYFHVNSTLADSVATGPESMAIGGGASASATGSIALGSNSVANRTNTVSVGSASTQRQVVNMAAGTSSTDAVNVSQLAGVTAALGGGAGVSGTDGSITKPSYTIGGKTYSDVGSAITAAALSSSPDAVMYDSTVHNKVTLGGTGSSTPVLLSNVADGVANNDAVNVEQLKAMGASVDTSGHITNAFVSYDDSTKNTITLKGASGSTKITGLTAGTLSASSTDAVNGTQLYATNQNVANVAGNVTNVTNTINNITNGTAGIKYFHVNSTLADSVATGPDAIAIGGGASASANSSVALGANSVANRANTVSVGSASTQRQVVNMAAGTSSTDAVNVSQLAGVTAALGGGATVSGTDGSITKPSYTIGGKTYTDVGSAITAAASSSSPDSVMYDSSVHNKVTLGGTGSSTPVLLSNLTAGAVTSSSHDAVNGSQLYGVSSSVANALGGNSSVSASGAVTKPTYALSSGTFADVGSALGALDSSVSSINNNIADTTKYIKVVSVSSGAIATGAESMAIGGGAYAGGANSVAIGAGARSQFAGSIALGSNAVTSADNTISVGSRGSERRIMNVANGLVATDVATYGQLTALQTSVSQQLAQQTSGVKSMLLGATPAPTPSAIDYISVSSNITPGASPTSTDGSQNAMAIGPVATAQGVGSLAVGANSATFHSAATAVGSNAVAGALNATAIGASATTGYDSVSAVAIGYNASANGANSLALGSSTLTNANNTIALGSNAFVDSPGANSLALGASSSVSAANSVAIGYASVANRANSVSVGAVGAERQITNVAQGTSSTDAVNVQQLNSAIATVSGGGGSANAVVYDTTAHTKVTLGGTSSTVPVALTNLATGQITSSSKDAINGSQLYGTAASVAAALGGSSTVKADGTLSKPAYALDGSTYSDVGAALAAVDAKAGSGSVNGVSYDSAAHTKVTLGGAGASSMVTVSNVADGVANNDAVNVQQLKAMGANIDSSGNVTGAFVAYDDSSKGKVTLGGVGASLPVALTNIAVGQITSNSKDAINGSQLYGTASSVATALGGGSTVDTNGKLSKPSYNVDGGTYNDVGSAINAVASLATTGSGNGVVYDSSKRDMLTLGGVNATTPVTVANVAAATTDNEAVNLKQLKDAGLNVDTSGNVSNAFVAYDNLTKGTVTFNAGGAPTQLKNVAAATDLTDAVNFGQMQTYVDTHAGSGGSGTSNAVAYDDSTKGQVTLGGVGSTTPVVLTNVAAGTSATDAVNYSQFTSLQSQVNNLATGGEGSTYINIGAPGAGTTGTASVASGTDAIAIGNGASATGDSAIAIGAHTHTSGDHSVALGDGASAPNNNSVALGSNSTTDRDNTVSVGSIGNDRQITNVAAGTQTTDAVNFGQLNNAIGGLNNSISNVDRSAAKGIASASALNIVTPYLPGRTTINAGVANYRGYQALGIGVSRWNEKGTINYNLGVSSSGGNSTIVRAGIGIVLGN